MQAMETLSQSSQRPPAQAAGWQFWVDRGGTFTDVIGLSPAGELHVRKVPSTSAGGAAGDPGLHAVRAILGAAGAAGAAPRAVAAVKVGTTVATNTLLTRSGEPVVLVTSAGFADALRIGYQNRPDIFARDIVLPEPLYGTVIEAHERIDAHGAVLTPLDGARPRAPRRCSRGGHRLPAWLAPSATRAGGSKLRTLARLRGSVGVARAVAAGALRQPRRHHGPQCLPRAAAAQLRRRAARAAARARSAGAPDAHAEQRRTGGRGELPRHVERVVGARGRAHRHALGRGAPGLPAPDRLRHGRHVHGRVTDRRRAAAALRAPHCRSAPDPADAGR